VITRRPIGGDGADGVPGLGHPAIPPQCAEPDGLKEIAVIGQIIGLIVVGLIIGALARLITPGRQHMSIVATLALGVVGAFIGGTIGGLLNDNTSPFELNVLGFIFAVIAAVLLVGIAERLSSGRSRAVR
jgi:uncharacterized membrane protein YeaQ/YmgE (transglycosylase-associated protein family)